MRKILSSDELFHSIQQKWNEGKKCFPRYTVFFLLLFLHAFRRGIEMRKEKNWKTEKKPFFLSLKRSNWTEKNIIEVSRIRYLKYVHLIYDNTATLFFSAAPPSLPFRLQELNRYHSGENRSKKKMYSLKRQKWGKNICKQKENNIFSFLLT